MIEQSQEASEPNSKKNIKQLPKEKVLDLMPPFKRGRRSIYRLIELWSRKPYREPQTFTINSWMSSDWERVDSEQLEMISQALEHMPELKGYDSSIYNIEDYRDSKEEMLRRARNMQARLGVRFSGSKSREEDEARTKRVCIEEVCLEPAREFTEYEHIHEGHRSIGWEEFLEKIEVLRCNAHFKIAEEGKTAQLLSNMEHVYRQIVTFEREICRIFAEMKTKVRAHIQKVKQSFEQNYYFQVRETAAKQFSFETISLHLEEAETFERLKYSCLDYPVYKIGLIQSKISEINLNNKAIAIESIQTWAQRLLGRDKLDSLSILSRSVDSFMFKTPGQKRIFSYYLRSPEYLVTDTGKRLQRISLEDINPVIVVEKELVTQTEIKFKITRLGKGIMFGVADLAELEKGNFKQSIKGYESAYLLSHKGSLLPRQKCERLKSQGFSFTQGSIVSMRREADTILFGIKRGEKFEYCSIKLREEELRHRLYPCFFLEDLSGIVDILQ